MVNSINTLLHNHGLIPITKDFLTNKDLWVIAKRDNQVVGFIWGGKMANGTMLYIDRFVVHPEYKNQGIAKYLREVLYLLAKGAGIKEVHGVIRHSKYRDAATINSLKMAIGFDPAPYTFVHAQMAWIESEIDNNILSSSSETGNKI